LKSWAQAQPSARLSRDASFPANAAGPPLPFDDPAYLFELKYDGFGALAVVEYGRCTLYSRNGHSFASFQDLATRIGNALMLRSLVMDREIVCLDEHGHCQFSELLFRRGEPRFIAFESPAREWHRFATRKIAGQETRTATNNWLRSAADHLCRSHS